MDNYLYYMFGTAVFFVLVGFGLSFWNRYRANEKKGEYKEIRDALTKTRNSAKNVQESVEDTIGHISLVEIAICCIGIGIVAMVGFLVVSQVTASLDVQNEHNVTREDVKTSPTMAVFSIIIVGVVVLAAFGIISALQG